TPPPNDPECRSRTGPVSVTPTGSSPRMPVHMDGTSAAHMVVSLITITSQASRSRSRRSRAAKCSEPDSSSPSTISLTVTGGGAVPDVAVPGRVGGDRRDGQPLLEVIDEFAGIRLDIATDVHGLDGIVHGLEHIAAAQETGRGDRHVAAGAGGDRAGYDGLLAR